MSIKYIEVLDERNPIKKHAIIDLEDLCLDKRNPRFSSSTIIGNKREIREEDIIEYLLRFGKVAELAESINRNYGLYDEEWISCYRNDNEEIIVLEGNRRVAACKILNNEEIVPQRVRESISIPSVNKEKTLPNIKKIKAIIYENEKDAQNYIAAKHTKPEVKQWETIEQCNYYYEQFANGVEPNDMAYSVGEDIKKVREKIKQFGLFKKVFDVVNSEYTDVLIEDINILPLVTKFFPPLISKKGKIGLNLSFDEESLTYCALPEKADVFKKILLKIGEAFFVRPKLRGGDIQVRDSSAEYRISTEEIKSKIKVEKLIIENIRIPDLYSLILEYKDQESKESFEKDKSKGEEQYNQENHPDSNMVKDNVTRTNSYTDDKKTDDDRENGGKRTLEFFADIRYSNLINRKDYLGIVLVCEEIQRISLYNGGSAYKQFPISSAFLLRSLIEQVLSGRLKQKGRYDAMVTGSTRRGKKSPELGRVIEVFLKDFQNGNLSLFWDDGELGKEFNKCFSGYGTKDQLDTIIHNPHLIQPDHNFLNSLSNQGLRLIIQGFLDRL